MMVTDAVEEVLSELGLGRWQCLVLTFSMLSHVILPTQQLGSTFLSAPVPFRCMHPQHVNVTSITNNASMADFPSQCLQFTDFQEVNQRDSNEVTIIKLNQHLTSIPSCPIVEYDTSVFHATVITEFDLVCEDSRLRPLFQMAFSIGALVGCLFSGNLSDWLGRKRTLQVGVLVTVVSVLATSLVPWYVLLIFMRILSGAGSMVMLFPAYTLISEISPPSRRTITALIPGMTYFAGMGAFGGLAYVVPHWRRLLILGNTPLLLMVPLVFAVTESPRWLIQRGKTNEAAELLRNAAFQNGVELSSSATLSLQKLEQMSNDAALAVSKGKEGAVKPKTPGAFPMLLACFSSPGMRLILIVAALVWFLLRSLYTGIVLNANNFASGNPFRYVAFLGTMGVLALILSLPLSAKLTRKVFLGGSMAMAGALLLLDLAVPEDYSSVKWIMVLTAFCLVAAAFQVIYIFVAELFPTVFRTRGYTFTNFAGSLGELAMPFITDVVVQEYWWASNVTFGCSGIAASLLLQLLPETKDRPMPETFQDVEDRHLNDCKRLKEDSTPSKISIIMKDT